MTLLKTALLLATLTAGAAQAATYTVDVTAEPFRQPGVGGLQTRAVILPTSGPQTYTGSTINFTLTNLGDSFTTILYGLVAYDAPLQADDEIARAVTTSFDFGAIGAVTLDGISRAFLTSQSVLASFTGNRIRLDATTGIKISIKDTVYGNDGEGYVDGREGVGFVEATFTLAPVPLPASLPLLAVALGALGLYAKRRKAA